MRKLLSMSKTEPYVLHGARKRAPMHVRHHQAFSIRPGPLMGAAKLPHPHPHLSVPITQIGGRNAAAGPCLGHPKLPTNKPLFHLKNETKLATALIVQIKCRPQSPLRSCAVTTML